MLREDDDNDDEEAPGLIGVAPDASEENDPELKSMNGDEKEEEEEEGEEASWEETPKSVPRGITPSLFGLDL